jgi:hypothetical protein
LIDKNGSVQVEDYVSVDTTQLDITERGIELFGISSIDGINDDAEREF